MAFVQLYVDESGTHRGSQYFVLAGHIGTVEQWTAFTDKWGANLRRCGLTWFHMTDAESRKARIYRDWSDTQREDYISSFSAIIEAHELLAIAVSASTEAWSILRAVVAPFPPLDKELTNLYGLMVGLMLSTVEETFCGGAGIPAHEIEAWFAEPNEINKFNRDLIGSTFIARGFSEPLFRAMRTWPALQAADMCAWLIRKRRENTAMPLYPRHVGIISAVRHYELANKDVLRLAAVAADRLRGVVPTQKRVPRGRYSATPASTPSPSSAPRS